MPQWFILGLNTLSCKDPKHSWEIRRWTINWEILWLVFLGKLTHAPSNSVYDAMIFLVKWVMWTSVYCSLLNAVLSSVEVNIMMIVSQWDWKGLSGRLRCGGDATYLARSLTAWQTPPSSASHHGDAHHRATPQTESGGAPLPQGFLSQCGEHAMWHRLLYSTSSIRNYLCHNGCLSHFKSPLCCVSVIAWSGFQPHCVLARVWVDSR